MKKTFSLSWIATLSSVASRTPPEESASNKTSSAMVPWEKRREEVLVGCQENKQQENKTNDRAKATSCRRPVEALRLQSICKSQESLSSMQAREGQESRAAVHVPPFGGRVKMKAHTWRTWRIAPGAHTIKFPKLSQQQQTVREWKLRAFPCHLLSMTTYVPPKSFAAKRRKARVRYCSFPPLSN